MGLLPSVFAEKDPLAYLQSYVQTYLREEVQQEGLTRNLAAFSRFLEAASYSQGCVLNMAGVARDCMIDRKVAENYFTIAEDLLLAHRIPIFNQKAKRQLVLHPKFFFFDAGVYQTLRPSGPLDDPGVGRGAAYETLCLQHLIAYNAYQNLGYHIHYWRTRNGLEVDFVLYGPRGLIAIEAKNSQRIRREDTSGLHAFAQDYPQAHCVLVYRGDQEFREQGIHFVNVERFLKHAVDFLQAPANK